MVSNVCFDFLPTAWNDIFVRKSSKISNGKHSVIMKQVRRIRLPIRRIDSSIFSGQLYGLEKFWAFLKYSKQKPKINPKLDEILKSYKCLEDFRVDGASFPQQFYPTKSGIIVNRDFVSWRHSSFRFCFQNEIDGVSS